MEQKWLNNEVIRMEIDDIINKIILIPHKFNELKNISFYELLKETGYFQVYDKILEKMILKKLSLFPKYIEEWIIYSEDKRTNSGYYIKQEGNNYIVGYLNNKGKSMQKKYSDKIEACASFIKYEIEEIRNST